MIMGIDTFNSSARVNTNNPCKNMRSINKFKKKQINRNIMAQVNLLKSLIFECKLFAPHLLKSCPTVKTRKKSRSNSDERAR